MQICTSLQTDNHASTSLLGFLQAGCPSCRPTNSVKALKAQILCRTSTKNSYAMHTIKISPNLLFEYQCTSGKFIRLPNRIENIDSVARIESKLFLPELECSSAHLVLCVCTAVQDNSGRIPVSTVVPNQCNCESVVRM